jgi:hypothetical protein
LLAINKHSSLLSLLAELGTHQSLLDAPAEFFSSLFSLFALGNAVKLQKVIELGLSSHHLVDAFLVDQQIIPLSGILNQRLRVIVIGRKTLLDVVPFPPQALVDHKVGSHPV